jgi:hypothetical protein
MSETWVVQLSRWTQAKCIKVFHQSHHTINQTAK